MKQDEKQIAQAKLDRMIRASNTRILEAVTLLNSHHRGQTVLKELDAFLHGAAGGLDSGGWQAVETLLREHVHNHRRGFLEKHVKVGRKELEAYERPCVYCGEVDCEDKSDCPKRRRHMEEDAKDARFGL